MHSLSKSLQLDFDFTSYSYCGYDGTFENLNGFERGNCCLMGAYHRIAICNVAADLTMIARMTSKERGLGFGSERGAKA